MTIFYIQFGKIKCKRPALRINEMINDIFKLGISLGPMRLIFVELSCLQAKIANFHV